MGVVKRLCWMVPVIGLLAGGCTANSLEGSIGDTLSLGFDRVKLKKQDAFLVTEYLRDTLRGTEKICKLSVDTEGLDLGGGPSIEGEEFFDRVELQRTTFDYDAFPPVQKGLLRFDHIDFRDGGSAEADFLIVFEDSHTLQGVFIGSIEEL